MMGEKEREGGTRGENREIIREKGANEMKIQGSWRENQKQTVRILRFYFRLLDRYYFHPFVCVCVCISLCVCVILYIDSGPILMKLGRMVYNDKRQVL